MRHLVATGACSKAGKAAVWPTTARTLTELGAHEIIAVGLELGLGNVVDDAVEVPTAAENRHLDGQNDCHDQQKVHAFNPIATRGQRMLAAISSKWVIARKSPKRLVISSAVNARTRSVPKFSTLNEAIVEP